MCSLSHTCYAFDCCTFCFNRETGRFPSAPLPLPTVLVSFPIMAVVSSLTLRWDSSLQHCYPERTTRCDLQLLLLLLQGHLDHDHSPTPAQHFSPLQHLLRLRACFTILHFSHNHMQTLILDLCSSGISAFTYTSCQLSHQLRINHWLLNVLDNTIQSHSAHLLKAPTAPITEVFIQVLPRAHTLKMTFDMCPPSILSVQRSLKTNTPNPHTPTHPQKNTIWTQWLVLLQVFRW